MWTLKFRLTGPGAVLFCYILFGWKPQWIDVVLNCRLLHRLQVPGYVFRHVAESYLSTTGSTGPTRFAGSGRSRWLYEFFSISDGYILNLGKYAPVISM